MKDLPINSKAGLSTRTYFPALLQPLPGLGILLLVALLLWFSLPTFVSLHPVWVHDYNYSHGYLVLAVTVFLVVMELRREPLAPFVPSWAGAALFVALAFMTTAAHAASTVAIAHLSLPLLWIAAVWTFAGGSNARRLALPLAFLYFAIPVWDAATEPLRFVTISIVSTGVRLLDVPAFIEGNLIHVPSGTFEVAGGCAGLRYAIVAATLGAFLGLLHHRHWIPTLVLTLCALGLALVGNWLRVFIIVLVGHYSEMQNYLIVEDHSFFGWVVFVVCIAPLVYVHHKLPSWTSPVSEKALSVGNKLAGYRGTVAYCGCAALVLGIWLNYRIDAGADSPLAAVLVAPEVRGWSRETNWEDGRRPDFVGATAQFSQWYGGGTGRVGVHVAHYARQGQGHEVVFSQHRPQGNGTVVSRRPITVPVASGTVLTFKEIEIADAIGRRLAWVGLRVAGQVASGETAARVLQIVGAIRGRRDAQALVLTAECAESCDNARATLSSYATVAAERLYEQAERSAPHDLEDQIL